MYAGNFAWRIILLLYLSDHSHPEVRDVCDIGRILFGGSKIAYELTMVGLILNNVFIQALHIVVGEKVLNTLSNHAICTVAFGAILCVIYFFCKLCCLALNSDSSHSSTYPCGSFDFERHFGRYIHEFYGFNKSYDVHFRASRNDFFRGTRSSLRMAGFRN
jgi:hypothetical protein